MERTAPHRAARRARRRSPQIDELLAACADREALPPVARAQLSRTVAALGFLRDSLELLPAPDPAERLSPEQAYVESTRYFTRSIQQLSAPGWTDEELAALYVRIPAAKETLRIRLLFAIAGCVLTAQRTQTARALAWRAAASVHLDEVKACREFSPFEQQLLESRYWRAVCYCPFLTGDRGALRTEAETCERLARELAPGNAHEERRDLAGARTAFLRAQALGAPLGYVAAYQAGRLSEQLGLHDEAILCQLRSLALWPSGLSPLIRLHALGRITGDAALVRFAEHGLARVRDHGTVAPAERARIEQLIGAAA